MYVCPTDILLLGEMMLLSFPFYIIFSSPIYNPNIEEKHKNSVISGSSYQSKDEQVYGGFHTLWDWDSVSIGLKKDGEVTWSEFLLEVVQVLGRLIYLVVVLLILTN
jgi:hypothetical protein